MRLAPILLVVVVVGMASPAAADDETPVEITITSSRGGLGKFATLLVIDDNDGIRACFRGSTDYRDVKVTLSISTAGAVSAVKLRGASKRVKTCLTTALKGLAFPTSAKKTTVRVTLSPEVSAMAYAEALTAEGDHSTVDSGMRSRPGADLNLQVGASTKGSGTGSGGASPASGPQGRITLASKKASGGHAVAVVVNKVLSAYLPGLKRCYKGALVTKPNLQGIVVLAFDITVEGRVGTASATGIDALAPCIRDQMTAWRFPATDAASSVELRLKLVPD